MTKEWHEANYKLLRELEITRVCTGCGHPVQKGFACNNCGEGRDVKSWEDYLNYYNIKKEDLHDR